MPTPHYRELVFDLVQDAGGGYVAECLSENIVTQGDTWTELRANVKDAVEAYFFDGPKPQSIRLHLVKNEVFQMQ
ncbi:MAG TPA: type II toxin-antitoxin system HicB family antitoxin [Verrucomicrobiae bacterium]|nr:type II toxin-antitoxin system HicB family antitoxin [Verrucomicrobiae bacterium]